MVRASGTTAIRPLTRSEVMARVKSKDTGPEMILRRLVHGLGFRYRLHRKDLPGSPDLAFPSRRIAFFVHGCFWHQHPKCKRARLPQTHTDYWLPKLKRNVARDRRNRADLAREGWRSVVFWECELRDPAKVRHKVIRKLRGR